MKNTLLWRTDKDLNIQQVLALYNAVNWTAYTEKPLELMRGISNSSYVVSSWKEERLVGLIRIMSDDFSIVYIQDVLVAPDFQTKA